MASKVEAIKQQSRALAGDIARGLAEPTAAFAGDDAQLLKFHGIYQGYDRDSATARKQQGLARDTEFMVRVRIPAGQLTAAQFLALDDLALAYGGGSLRVTTRQAIQFHGLIKGDLKPALAAINQALLTTLAACGDVVRNVTATPAPIADAVHRTLQDEARRLSVALTPATGAYHAIWVDGEQAAGPDEDALYGAAYLPRKFKIGLAAPTDNAVDVLTNDLAFIAVFEGDRLAGYNVAVGGGQGMTHNKPNTYPRLATPIAFVAPDDVVAIAKAVVAVQRDHGDRTDRKRARLKYLIDGQGVEWFTRAVESAFGRALEGPRALPRFKIVDHAGWHAQGDGRVYFGLSIANGRVKDTAETQLRTALRRILIEVGGRPILTPTQDILIADLRFEDRDALEAILREHGVPLPYDLSPVARWALACPALPTCSQALNEAERIRVDLIGAIEAALARQGLADAKMSIRITGCPNGCARPYTGDVGIVGRTPDSYAIYLGGDFEGTRLNRLVFERVKLTDIAATLEPLFAAYARECGGEGFGDFCERLGIEALRALAAPAELSLAS